MSATNLIANAVWLLGLAVMLAVFSLRWTALPFTHRTVRAALLASLGRKWLYAGLLLLAAGRVVAAGSLIESACWVTLAIWSAWLIWVTPNNPAVELPLEIMPPTNTSALPARAADWVVRFEPLILLLASPFFLLPAPGRAFGLAVLPLLWIARRAARGRFVPPTPFDWPIALLLLMVLVSIYATHDLVASLGKISGVLFGVGLYYALVEWTIAPRRLRWVTALHVAAGLLAGVVGLLNASGVAKFPLLSDLLVHLPGLAQGLTGGDLGINPNEVGGMLLWIVPLPLALLVPFTMALRRQPALLGRWAGLLVVVLLALATLLLSQSRSAIGGLVFAAVVVLWLVTPRLRPALAVVAVLGVALVAYLGPDQITGSLENTLGRGVSVSQGVLTLEGRAQIWQRAVYAIQDYPLTGTGMNVFRELLPQIYPLFSVDPQLDIGHSHDQMLQAALDLGLPGLVAYVTLLLVAATVAVQAWRRTRNVFARSIAAGVGVGLIAYCVFGVTDVVALGAKPGVFFWTLLALLVIVWRGFAPPQTELAQ